MFIKLSNNLNKLKSIGVNVSHDNFNKSFDEIKQILNYKYMLEIEERYLLLFQIKNKKNLNDYFNLFKEFLKLKTIIGTLYFNNLHFDERMDIIQRYNYLSQL